MLLDQIRYWVAVVILLSLPLGILLWLFIHPFARFWRRVGPVWTYGILVPPLAAGMGALWWARRFLMRVEYGTRYPLMVLALVSFVVAGVIAAKRGRLLTFGILSGIPELSRDSQAWKLLTEGIYSRVRHPRYIETMFWVLGYALFANYLALYVALLLLLPVIHLIVLLEERELRERFGSAYEEYCRRVPRYSPKLVRRGAGEY
jgi:hypothetical protein